ncbi:MAG: hypothetical protein WCD53_15345 [Microcoleus sp.]
MRKNPVSLIPAQKPETGFLPQYLVQTLNLPKNPVSLIPAQKPETGFLPQYLVQTLDFAEKPGFFSPYA